jgi:hypothetical protein
MTRALYREGELALMLRAGTGNTAGNYLPLLGSKLHEALLILVIDVDIAALAEPAGFSLLYFFYW